MNNNFQPHPDRYVNALLTNNSLVLTEIYDKYSAKITRMIKNNNGTEEDAADVFSESLVCIYVSAIKSELVLRSGFWPYFKRVCINKWIDKLNENKKQQKIYRLLNQDASYTSNEFEIVEFRTQLMRLVGRIFSTLSDRDQHIINLSLDNKPMKEIAATLDTTSGSIRKCKSQILKRLKALIKQSPEYALLLRYLN